jgi:Zn-dependent protease/tetratricopeptide (TPR) repeat protein
LTPPVPPAPAGVITFRCAGIPIAIHPSFWVVTLLIGSRGREPRLIAVWAAVVLFSIILHELGHAFAARAFGGVPRIELHSMGGTTYTNAKSSLATWQSIVVSLSGPCAGLALGAIVFALRPFAAPGPEQELIVRTAISDLLWVNWGYGLLNFLPILPLDGGRVMETAIAHVRRRPSANAAAIVSLTVAAGLAIVAVVWQLHWAFFMLGWLAMSHVRSLVPAWRKWREPEAVTLAKAGSALAKENDAALADELVAIDAAVTRSEFAWARERAEALWARARSPRDQAHALSALVHIHLYENHPELAAATLQEFPADWQPDAELEARVWMQVGQPRRAVDRLRSQLAARPDPELVRALVTALLATEDLSGAMQYALAEPATMERLGLFEVGHRLFLAARFEDSARVSAVAFERFSHPDDAYNLGCAFAGLGRLDEAMRWLERAVAAGYANGAHLDSDDDLAALRARDDFAALRAVLQSKSAEVSRSEPRAEGK